MTSVLLRPITTHRSNFSISVRTQVGEAVPSSCMGGVRAPLGSAGRGLQGGGGGRGLSGARGRGLNTPACCWRWGGFGGTVEDGMMNSLMS